MDRKSSAFYSGAIRYGGSSAIALRREAARKAFFTVKDVPSSSSTKTAPTTWTNTSNSSNVINSYTINTNDIIRKETTSSPQLTSAAKRILKWIEENSATTTDTLQLNKRRRTKYRFNPMSYRAPIQAKEPKTFDNSVSALTAEASKISASSAPPPSHKVELKWTSPPTFKKPEPVVKKIPEVQPPTPSGFTAPRYCGPTKEIQMPPPSQPKKFAEPTDLTPPPPPPLPQKSVVPSPQKQPKPQQQQLQGPKQQLLQESQPKPVQESHPKPVQESPPKSVQKSPPQKSPIFTSTLNSTPSKLPLIFNVDDIAPPTFKKPQPVINKIPEVQPPAPSGFQAPRYCGPAKEIQTPPPSQPKKFTAPADLTPPPAPTPLESVVPSPQKQPEPQPQQQEQEEKQKQQEPDQQLVQESQPQPVQESQPQSVQESPQQKSPIFSSTSNSIPSKLSPVVGDVEMDIDAEPLSTIATTAPVVPITTVPTVTSTALMNTPTQLSTPTQISTLTSALAPTTTMTTPTFSQPVFGMPAPNFPTPTFAPTLSAPTAQISMPNGNNPFAPPTTNSVRGRKILRPARRLHR